METDIPDPAERFTILREELRLRFEARGPRHAIARVLDVLMWHLFMHLISVSESLAKRRAERQACTDDAVAAEGFAAAGGDDGAEPRAAAGGPDAGRLVVARAAVAAAAGTPVIDMPVIDMPVIGGATQEDCIRDERAVGAAGERRPCERRHPAANLATMGRGVAGLEYGCRVLAGRFAKTGLRARVELRRFSYDLATKIDEYSPHSSAAIKSIAGIAWWPGSPGRSPVKTM